MAHGGHEGLVHRNRLLSPAAVEDEAALVPLVFVVSQDVEDRTNGQGATKIFGGGKTIEYKVVGRRPRDRWGNRALQRVVQLSKFLHRRPTLVDAHASPSSNFRVGLFNLRDALPQLLVVQFVPRRERPGPSSQYGLLQEERILSTGEALSRGLRPQVLDEKEDRNT